ncbi:MAG: DUF547 domain-containing protein [Bdellovibrionota bacterium]
MYTQVLSSLFAFFLILSTATPQAQAEYDHSHADLDKVLKEHVTVKDDGNTFAYAKLKRKPVDFIRYLKNASRLSEKSFNAFTREQQIAFLINVYNAFTIQLVMDNYPTPSIKKIKGLSPSPWKVNFIRLLGKTMNLDNIETDWLRKKYNDPRIHFAVNSSTISSPRLRNEAYVADRLNEQLDDQARLFLRNPAQNKINPIDKKLELSKIFTWYKDDFTKDQMTVQKFVSKYITDEKTVQASLEKEEFAVDYLDYSWDLNSTK